MQLPEFPTIDLLWMETLRQLLDAPTQDSRNGGTKEIIGFSATLTDPTANFIGNPIRKMSPSYAAGEMFWYLAGSQQGSFIEHYAPGYERFLQADGTAYGAYGMRMAEDDQIHRVMEILTEDSTSRQAIISMWCPETDLAKQDEKGHPIKDRPCTLSLQFLVRGGKLHCICTMRSNDVWLGLPYDVFCFTTLQQLIAAELGLGLGAYKHQAGSMHIYDTNMEKAANAVHLDYYGFKFKHEPTTHKFQDMLRLATDAEEAYRLERAMSLDELGLEEIFKTYWGQLVMMASSRNQHWSEAELTAVLPLRIADLIAADQEKRNV